MPEHRQEMPLVDLGGGGGGPNIELLIYLVIRGTDRTVSNDKPDAEVVDEMEVAFLVQAREQRQLGEGRAAVDQRSARIVADAAEDRRPDARRADHRMRLTPKRPQRPFELEEHRARQAHDLLAVVDQMQSGDAHGVDQDDVLGNLTLERNVEGSVARHGLLLHRPSQNRSISQRPPVHLEGCHSILWSEQGIQSKDQGNCGL